jgi:hypothetical protein
VRGIRNGHIKKIRPIGAKSLKKVLKSAIWNNIDKKITDSI